MKGSRREDGVRRRVPKLWRVLVMGGALIAAACNTTGKAKDGKEGASSGPSGGATDAGGAKSW